ncbi:MAG: twin-arginine translocase TatA/TatE family subunit [Caulobacterales bacterium]
MHMPGIWGLLIVGLLAVILFGRPGKLSGFMEDLGKGIKGFRKGLGDEQGAAPAQPVEPARQLPDQAAVKADAQRDKTSA